METAVEFEEQAVTSLKVNGETVEVAREGDDTGIAPCFPKEIMREGARVFRVLTTTDPALPRTGRRLGDAEV
jgi:hypothetical protein